MSASLDRESLELVVNLQQGFESIKIDVARLRVEPSPEQRRSQSIAIINICSELAAEVIDTIGVDVPATTTNEILLGSLFSVNRDSAAHIAHLVSAEAQLDRAWTLAAASDRSLQELPKGVSRAAMTLCEQDVEDRWLTRRLSARGVTLVDVALGCGAWEWLQARRGIHPMNGGWAQHPPRVEQFGEREELAALGLVLNKQDLKWLGCPDEETILLRLSGLTKGFSPEQYETLDRLAVEWDDSVGTLIAAARSL
jgi:hypothetical protein